MTTKAPITARELLRMAIPDKEVELVRISAKIEILLITDHRLLITHRGQDPQRRYDQ